MYRVRFTHPQYNHVAGEHVFYSPAMANHIAMNLIAHGMHRVSIEPPNR